MASQAPQPKVTLFVLNWNRQQMLAHCLDMLAEQTYTDLRTVVIDNGSVDDSVAMVKARYPDVSLIENRENVGFGRGINVGLRTVDDFSAEHLLVLLNNDVVIERDWLAQMVCCWQATANVGIASCTLMEDAAVVHTGGRINAVSGFSEHYAEVGDRSVCDADYVTGAAFMFSAETLQQVGLFDELFAPLYYEEVDYCYRVRATGKRIVVFRQIEAQHAQSTSVDAVPGLKAKSIERNRLKFVIKHFSAEQFRDDFLPFEHKRLRHMPTSALQQQARQALTEAIVTAPALLTSQGREADLPLVLDGLLQLRDLTLPAGFETIEATYPPYQFRPTVAGRLRKAWYAVAGKWALRYNQQEQQQINSAVVDTLHVQTTADEMQYLLQRYVALEKKMLALEAQLDADAAQQKGSV